MKLTRTQKVCNEYIQSKVESLPFVLDEQFHFKVFGYFNEVSIKNMMSMPPEIDKQR